jgi:hypothetical protein
VSSRRPDLLAALAGTTVLAVVLFTQFLATSGASAAAGTPTDAGFGSVTPVNVVILADESGSMQQFPNEITGMRAAAAQIVSEEWSPQSQISIYGFGSAPPGDQLQAAVDQYCAPTELSTEAARARLEQCAAEIAPRTAAQGWNTDFAEALTQAKNVLGEPQPTHRLPLVFVMTDGQLDVGAGSPYAGPNSSDAAGNAAAQQLITNPATGILHQLRSIGAEVWPVGFGQADRGELSLFAQGGARNGCPAGSGATPAATLISPTATGVTETEDIQSALVSAFAEARCAVAGRPAWLPLAASGMVSKTVTIGPLATLGSIVVDKGDPRVTVTFIDPKGARVSDTGPSSGSVDGASYTLTQVPQSPLETLRLDNPLTGPWTVVFKDPAGVPAQTVGLSVVWQGEVQLEFTDQRYGDPGHSYTLTVQPAVRSAPVAASALGGVRAAFTVDWPNGQVAAVAGSLNEAGDFTAPVLVPSQANGIARVTVTAAAPGVQGTADTAVQVVPGGGITVALSIPPGTHVAPGGSITTQATINTNGAPRTSVVLALGGLADGVDAVIAKPTGAISVGSGQMQVPVTIAFGSGTRLGPALGTIDWAPATQGTPTPSDWLAADSLDVIVAYPPTPWFELPWPWLALFVVLVAGCLLLLWRRRTQREQGWLFPASQPAAAGSPYRVQQAPGELSPDRWSAQPGPRGAGAAATGRWSAEPGRPPGDGADGTTSASETKHTARWGWRLPWR